MQSGNLGRTGAGIVFLTLVVVAKTGWATEPDSRSSRIESVFNGLSAENMGILEGFYDVDATLVDPLGRHDGLDAIRAYYEGMYESVKAIDFAFDHEIVEGDEHVLFWTMTMTAKKMNKGRAITVEGSSLVRFGENDRVIFHRDYFDMGAMVYRHVPVLRWGVKKVNARLNPAYEHGPED